jgi:hypothetical protein
MVVQVVELVVVVSVDLEVQETLLAHLQVKEIMVVVLLLVVLITKEAEAEVELVLLVQMQ